MTNISELVEYVLLPHNDDVVKPRALKTFIDGLAELGINKRLIQNKKILAELMEKERAYRGKDGEAGDEEMVSESSDNEDGTETASEYSEHQKSETWRKFRRSIFWRNRKSRYFAYRKRSLLLSIATEKTFTKEQ